MRLGFLSYDFNDHPTAHLVEGIFETVATCTHTAADCGRLHLPTSSSDNDSNSKYSSTNTSTGCNSTTNNSDTSSINSSGIRGTVFDDVELVVFSYGKDDGSVYRKQLKKVRIMTPIYHTISYLIHVLL